uniref:Uncharacterized protein n=1 Tax=Klebsiella pneumoniae TaxID=573 RepID=A0A8B0SUU6_KLEPN|nr:hypothetical protein [Klebsiella pneumoniae]
MILSYHMGYFLSDWPFWQVYAILALAYFAGRFGLKKRASSKDEPQEGKNYRSVKALPVLACSTLYIQATQSIYGKKHRRKKTP